MAYLAILDNNWPIADWTSGPDRGHQPARLGERRETGLM